MRTLLVFLTLSAAALGQQGNGPTQHFAIQSWTNPTGTLTGNCVYRSQAAGGPYGPAIFCSTVPITTYTDFTVLTGQTYYFVVTAYTAGPPFEEGPVLERSERSHPFGSCRHWAFWHYQVGGRCKVKLKWHNHKHSVLPLD